jgi:TonB family protein
LRIDPGTYALAMGLLGVSLLFPSAVLAGPGQAAPAETSAPAEHRVRLVSRPSFVPIADALQATGRTRVHAVAIVRYDAAGVIQAVRLDPGTGAQAVDDAIVAWCKAATLTPGAAGEGRLPFDLSVDDSPAASVAELPEIRTEHFVERPPMKDLIRTFVETGRRGGSLELGLEYAADGVITHVEVIRSSGNATLDQAAVDWTKRARLRAGDAGRGRLPFKFGLQ